MLNRSVLLATVLALGLGISTGTHAIPVVYTANLAGSNEIPGNASTGTGLATVTLDVAAHTLRVQVTFAGLSAPVTAAHIHCCLASPNAAANVGVATSTPTFTGFPSGVMSGSYDNTVKVWNVATGQLACEINVEVATQHRTGPDQCLGVR